MQKWFWKEDKRKILEKLVTNFGVDFGEIMQEFFGAGRSTKKGNTGDVPHSHSPSKRKKSPENVLPCWFPMASLVPKTISRNVHHGSRTTCVVVPYICLRIFSRLRTGYNRTVCILGIILFVLCIRHILCIGLTLIVISIVLWISGINREKKT